MTSAAPPIPLPLAADARRLLALAWPVVLVSLNWTILHVTDVVVVGLVSTGEAAALGASRAITFIAIVAALGWLSGVLVSVSRAEGAGDLAATGRHLRSGLALAVVLGIALAAALIALPEAMLRALGVDAGIAPAAARVVRVMGIAFPFQLVIVAASYFLEGISRPRRVMVINLAVLPMNALLAWALSAGHLGLPALGAVGAATATAIASAAGACGMVAACLTAPHARERGLRDWAAASGAEVRNGAIALMRFGAVPALASGLELAGFSILIALSTQLGTLVAHGFQIVFSIHNVTFALAIGLGSAAGVRVGNAVGEGLARDALRRAALAAALAAVPLAAAALVLVFAAAPIVAQFPGDPRAHAAAVAMLAVWAPFVLFDGLQVVFVYALRSLGDQVAAGLCGIVAFFIVTGGLGLGLVHAGMDSMALPWASGLGMLTAALLSGARLVWVSGRVRPES